MASDEILLLESLHLINSITVTPWLTASFSFAVIKKSLALSLALIHAVAVIVPKGALLTLPRRSCDISSLN